MLRLATTGLARTANDALSRHLSAGNAPGKYALFCLSIIHLKGLRGRIRLAISSTTYQLIQGYFVCEEVGLLFAALLSLQLPEDRYPPLNLSPQRQRQKTLETIVAMLLQ